jgi:hypothetical protein
MPFDTFYFIDTLEAQRHRAVVSALEKAKRSDVDDQAFAAAYTAAVGVALSDPEVAKAFDALLRAERAGRANQARAVRSGSSFMDTIFDILESFTGSGPTNTKRSEFPPEETVSAEGHLPFASYGAEVRFTKPPPEAVPYGPDARCALLSMGLLHGTASGISAWRALAREVGAFVRAYGDERASADLLDEWAPRVRSAVDALTPRREEPTSPHREIPTPPHREEAGNPRRARPRYE